MHCKSYRAVYSKELTLGYNMKKIVFIIILVLINVGYTGNSSVYGQNSPYEKILTTHPRIIINEYNRDGLRKKINWKLSSAFQRFIDAQHNPGEDTQAICRYVYSQAYAYQMTGEAKWADKAIAVMENMPEFFAQYGTLPDSAAHCLEALAIGYDWCYDRIAQTTGKKQKFIELIKVFAGKAQQEFERGIYTDFHNYATNFETAVLFAGLALYREDGKATDYLDWARGIVETGYQLNRTTYKLIDSINYVDGACNWESSSYQRISLFAILKYIDGWDTATGGAFDAWNTTFKSIENAGYYFIYSVQPNNVLAPLGDNAYLEVNFKDMNNLACLEGKFKNSHFRTFLDAYFKWDYGVFTPAIPCDQGSQLEIFYMIWYDPEVPKKPLEELPLARKFGNDIVLRTGWSPKDLYITFRAGIHWGFHSHLDHGSFTIFKNAPLAIDSGYYDLWSPGTHIWDYWKRSIAHSVVTVYSPQEVWPAYAHKTRLNDGGQRMVFRKLNPPHKDSFGYWKSGSTNEPLSIRYLNEHFDEFLMGKIVAFENRQNYDYIRADLSNAYANRFSGQGDNQRQKTSKVERELVFLRPNLVVILDRIDAIYAYHKKAWLLHCGKYRAAESSAPYINTGGAFIQPSAGISEHKSTLVRVDNAEGRLYWKVILPSPSTLRVIGGKDYEFLVGSKNIPIGSKSIRDADEPGAWRIEVMPDVPKKQDVFFNVFFVCDSTEESVPLVKTLRTDGIIAAQIGNKIIAFSQNGENLNAIELQFDISAGDTDIEYFLFNLVSNSEYNIQMRDRISKKIIEKKLKSSSYGTLSFKTEGGENINIVIRKI